MKSHRIYIAITAAVFLLCISGCGSAGNSSETEKPQSAQSVTSEPVQEAELSEKTEAESSEEPMQEAEPSEEPASDTPSEPEVYAEKEVLFQDIVLTLDEGFETAGKVNFTALGQDVDEDNKMLRKKGFGTLSMHYERDMEFDQEAAVSGEEKKEDIDNPEVGTIIWADTAQNETDVHFTAHFMYDGDHYQLEFVSDDAMQGKNDELEEWFTGVLATLDLTGAAKIGEIEAYKPAQEPTAEPEEQLRINAVHVPGEEFTDQPAVWLGSDLGEYGWPETTPERAADDPIRVLLADYSDVVIIDGVGETKITDPAAYSSYILSRYNKLLKNFFEGEELISRIVFTTDPAEADVILTIRVRYPYEAAYTHGVKVYNCHVEVQIHRTGTDLSQTFNYENNAGSSLTVPKNTDNVWMSTPDGFGNEVGQMILEWMGEG